MSLTTQVVTLPTTLGQTFLDIGAGFILFDRVQEPLNLPLDPVESLVDRPQLLRRRRTLFSPSRKCLSENLLAPGGIVQNAQANRVEDHGLRKVSTDLRLMLTNPGLVFGTEIVPAVGAANVKRRTALFASEQPRQEISGPSIARAGLGTIQLGHWLSGSPRSDHCSLEGVAELARRRHLQ